MESGAFYASIGLLGSCKATCPLEKPKEHLHGAGWASARDYGELCGHPKPGAPNCETSATQTRELVAGASNGLNDLREVAGKPWLREQPRKGSGSRARR